MKMRKKAAFSVLMLCLTFWSYGFWAVQQVNPLETQQPSRFTLSNGLDVIYQFNPVSEVTVMLFLIKGGKISEPADKAGLANMTTRLSLEIPDRATLQKIMTQATQINMTSSMDYSFLSIASLSEHFESTIQLLAEILLNPLFSSIRIDNLRDSMNRSREFLKEDPFHLAHEKALEVFYGGTAYSGSIYGQEDTLKSIRKRDVDSFYETYFTAKNTAIFVASNMNEMTVGDILEEHFKDIPEGLEIDAARALEASLPEEKSIYIEKDTQQNLILFAFPIPKLSEKNYVLSNLLDSLIGNGVNSILWPLRVKAKLAYNVGTRLSLYKESGLFEVYLETDNEKLETARDALESVLDDLVERGVTEKDFAANLSYYKGSFLRQIETKRNRLFSLLFCEAMGLGSSFLDESFRAVDRTTLGEMNAFISEILSPDRRIEIIVGPKSADSEVR